MTYKITFRRDHDGLIRDTRTIEADYINTSSPSWIHFDKDPEQRGSTIRVFTVAADLVVSVEKI